MPEARVAEVVGPAEGPRAPSLIAIHAHDIPVEFDPQGRVGRGSIQTRVREGRGLICGKFRW